MNDTVTVLHSLFAINVEIRIIDILILCIIWMSFLRNKKLPLKSCRYFTGVLIVSSVNILFDLTSMYGVFHLSQMPPAWNRLLHQGFMATICMTMASNYFYVYSMEERSHSLFVYSLKKVIHLVPMIFCIVGIFFAPVYYYEGKDGAYSYGTMAYLTYVAVVAYYLMTIICLIRNWKIWDAEKKRNITGGLAIWGFFSVIQLLKPTILLSGTGLVLMILMNYMVFEDPKVYLNTENGCFNSAAYHKMLTEAFKKAKAFEVWQISFLEFDLVHGRYGHEVCQLILQNLSDIISKAHPMRVYSVEEETLAVILPAGNQKKLERMRSDLMALMEYDWSYHESRIHVTGILYQVACPSEVNSVLELEDTFSFMKKYENRGKRIIQADQKLFEEKKRYSEIVGLLETAILEDGFDVFYQPIFSTRSQSFHSAEALIRVRDTQTMGFVSPEEFIPIAEKEGMIMQIGEIVLTKVCTFAKNCQLMKHGIKYIEVNLSGVQCIDQGLPKQIGVMLQKFGLPFHFLNLEITETAAVESGEILSQNMMRLISQGVSFSMDDFGTGYSNLAQMADVSYHLIKIDKSLIWNCYPQQRQQLKPEETPEQSRAGIRKSSVVLTKVIELISELNLEIVAEGVETKEMVDMLVLNGVHYLQGYFFSRPLKEQDFMNFIIENR